MLDNDSKNHATIDTMNGFIDTYSSYEQAKYEAEQWKENGDCRTYGIYALCTDERNHVI